MRVVSKTLVVSLFSVVFFVFCHEAAAVATVHNNDTRSSSAAEKKIQRITNSTMAATMWNGIDLNSWRGHPDAVVDDPEEVARMVEMTIRNSTEGWRSRLKSGGGGGRRQLKRHTMYNVMDGCLGTKKFQKKHRKKLASCSLGFGRNAVGGLDGKYYVVTDSSDHDPVNPKAGTLRYAVIQSEPLWIIFASSMTITLKQELIVNSFKTLDGRFADVRIMGGAGITLQFVTNIIIHAITIQDVKPTGNAMVRSSPQHYGWRTEADGDAISLFGASNVWINHVTLSNCADGLIDAIMGSTAITISNCLFTHHNEVMLLGHSDSYILDKSMQVTIAFNHFGEGLIQRMPRCRHGYFHVVNNLYTHWIFYAIGGSASPTVNSQANIFIAPNNIFSKEVTRKVDDGTSKYWNWRSVGDLLMNGATFVQSGGGGSSSYARASSIQASPSSLVTFITSKAGNNN